MELTVLRDLRYSQKAIRKVQPVQPSASVPRAAKLLTCLLYSAQGLIINIQEQQLLYGHIWT